MKFYLYMLLALNLAGVCNIIPTTLENFGHGLTISTGIKYNTFQAVETLWSLTTSGSLTAREGCDFLYSYLSNNASPLSEEKFLNFKFFILSYFPDTDKKTYFENSFTPFEFKKFKFYKEYTSNDQFFIQVADALCLDPQDMSLKSDVDSLVRSLIFQEFDFEADEFNNFLSYFVDWMAAEKSNNRENINLDKFQQAIGSGFAEMMDSIDPEKAENLKNFFFNPNYTKEDEKIKSSIEHHINEKIKPLLNCYSKEAKATEFFINQIQKPHFSCISLWLFYGHMFNTKSAHHHNNTLGELLNVIQDFRENNNLRPVEHLGFMSTLIVGHFLKRHAEYRGAASMDYIRDLSAQQRIISAIRTSLDDSSIDASNINRLINKVGFPGENEFEIPLFLIKNTSVLDQMQNIKKFLTNMQKSLLGIGLHFTDDLSDNQLTNIIKAFCLLVKENSYYENQFNTKWSLN